MLSPRLELNHPKVKRDVQMKLMLSWIYPGILCQLKINGRIEMCTAKWVWLICFKCFFTTGLHSMHNSHVSFSLPLCSHSLKPHQPFFLLHLLSLNYKLDKTQWYHFFKWDLDQNIRKINWRGHFWRGQLAVEKHSSERNPNSNHKLLSSLENWVNTVSSPHVLQG